MTSPSFIFYTLAGMYGRDVVVGWPPPPDVSPPVNFHPSSKSSVGRAGSQCAIRPTRTKFPDCMFDGDRECALIVRPDGDLIEG